MENRSGVILVVGGAGKTGRRIVRNLQMGDRPVRATSSRVGEVRLDLADKRTWAPALSGVTSVYLMIPSSRMDLASRKVVQEFSSQAAEAGVRRIVLLSGIGVGIADDSHPLKKAEDELRASGVEWTILRPTWFSQNFSESYWFPEVLQGSLCLPTGDGRVSFIDAEDIAEVAVAALTGDEHAGRVYELTGPRAISFGEVADLIGKATQRVIRHVDVSPQAYSERLAAQGLPPEVARMRTQLHVAIREGRDGSASLSHDVLRVLGRPPRSFEDYVTRTALAGHWNCPDRP
ncbi:NAD(P)H-binding protein [Streptomyces sp. enrichment culture]|uniref:NAD(P)H-binding protein n=1 Tax=Streptomyces sp. enrichment culture TaxID=1795815 RepID=UPI003F571E15